MVKVCTEEGSMGAFLGYLSRQSLVVCSLPAPFGVGSCSHRMVSVGRDPQRPSDSAPLQ